MRRRLRAGAALAFAGALAAVPWAGTAPARTLSRLDTGERALIRELNRVRAAHGLPALRSDRALNRSADYHSRDMLKANFFGHTSSNGSTLGERLRRYRRSRRLGETIAYLPRRQSRHAARRVVRLWMDSAPHRAMLLSPTFRRIGVARRHGALGRDRVAVFTADFASTR